MSEVVALKSGVEDVNTEAPRSRLRTKDINEAAFLWSQEGAVFLRADGEAGKGTTVFFVVELPLSEVKLTSLMFAYYNSQCKVEPKEFAAKQMELRNILHSSFARYNK